MQYVDPYEGLTLRGTPSGKAFIRVRIRPGSSGFQRHCQNRVAVAGIVLCVCRVVLAYTCIIALAE